MSGIGRRLYAILWPPARPTDEWAEEDSAYRRRLQMRAVSIRALAASAQGNHLDQIGAAIGLPRRRTRATPVSEPMPEQPRRRPF